MKILDTLTPYDKLESNGGIQYGVCRDYSHISRYRGLRQLVHNPDLVLDRFICLETPNTIITNTDVDYYVVPHTEENRLDLIAYSTLGDPDYAWIIAYFNNITDGFSVYEGRKLAIPRSVTALFNKGEILAPISPSMLNLGSE